MVRKRSKQALALALLAGALTGGIGSTPAHAGPGLPEVPSMPPQGDFLDVTAKPSLAWSVPKRYMAGWAAYQEEVGGGSYPSGYATPQGWTVNLDACRSTSKYRITSFTFELVRTGALPPGTPHTSRVTSKSCQASFDRLPRRAPTP
jgi:hypothetical protein